MTWEQWVASDYNTIGAAKLNDKYIDITNYSDWNYNVIDYTGVDNYVRLNDLIRSGYSYGIDIVNTLAPEPPDIS